MRLANMAVLAHAATVMGVLTLAVPAQAADNGWYLGLGAGASNSLLDYDKTKQALSDGGFAYSHSDDDQDAAFRAFAGYRLHRNFALEGGYFDLGEFSHRAITVPQGQLDTTVRVRGLNLDLVGFLPMTEKLSLLGRVGAHYAKAKTHMMGTGAVATDMHDHKYSWNPKVGAGLQYDFTPMLAARAEWDHYRIRDVAHDRSRVNAYMASLVMSFGTAPQAVPVATTPVADEPAPAPEPVAPVAETGPSLKSASYTEESLFPFDSAELKPQGRTQLDQLAKEVRDMPYDRVTVTGHASRTGTDEYNMRLSERRAQAVRDYLVTTGGLDASRMVIYAKGESEPITRPEDCPGTDERNDTQLQKCLQPDRRVRVEVNAAK